MANKKNNENNEKNINMNINKEEKEMKKKAKKITVNMVDGVISIVKINGEACKEPRRFGTYTGGENNILPSITIMPKVGGWLKLSAYVTEDENGKMSVAVNHEPDAYWAMTEILLGSKKAVNAAKKSLIEARKNTIAAKEARQAEQNNNGTVIGATTHSYVYRKSMPSTQIEVVDLGRFGKRLMKWGKGLDCSKIYNGDKEVARIMWNKDGSSPKIRLMGEEGTRYYMLSYDQKFFIYFENKEKKVVMDSKLATALMFFYKHFVLKLAELKNWELPKKKQSHYDEAWWDSLEKEYEAEEAAYQARKNSNGNDKA